MREITQSNGLKAAETLPGPGRTLPNLIVESESWSKSWSKSVVMPWLK